MADLSLIIDPGGIAGVRDGINTQVFPVNFDETREKPVRGRTANSQLIVSSRGQFRDLTWRSLLSESEHRLVDSVVSFNIARVAQGFTSEVVIYDLFAPFSEQADNRTRFIVPGTSVIEQVVGTTTRWSYYVAMQGQLDTEWTKCGSGYWYDFNFVEGTFLSSSME
jgi:hypothetical protein